MYPDVGFGRGMKKRFQGDWERVFDFAVYLSKTIGKHIESPDILSKFIGWQSDEIGIDLEEIVGERALPEEQVEMEKEKFTTERRKLRNSLDDTINDLSPKSKAMEAVTSIWKKMINESKTLRSIRKFGRYIYKKLLQQILPFNFDDKGSFEKNNNEDTIFINTKLIKTLNKNLKKNMRKIIKKEIRC